MDDIFLYILGYKRSNSGRQCRRLLNAFNTQFRVTGFPECHNIVERIISRYFKLRLHIHAARVTKDHAKIYV